MGLIARQRVLRIGVIGHDTAEPRVNPSMTHSLIAGVEHLVAIMAMFESLWVKALEPYSSSHISTSSTILL